MEDFYDRTADFLLELQELNNASAQTVTNAGGAGPVVIGGNAEELDLQKPLIYQHRAAANPRQAKIQSQKNFASVASQISGDIHKATQEVESLVKMIKSQGLYRDVSSVIQQKIHEIKQTIQIISADIDNLERQQAQHRASLKLVNNQSLRHSANIVNNLKDGLATATKQFKTVLETRTKKMVCDMDRKKIYGKTSQKVRKRLTRRAHRETKEDESAGFNGGGGAQAQQMASPEEDSLLEGQTNEVESIERVIGELGQIYKHLADIVSMQNETIIRIDEDIDTTLSNVDSGHRQLLKYFETVSSNRWLAIKVFVVLILFVIFFSVFVA